jgi:hypothetical protein
MQENPTSKAGHRMLDLARMTSFGQGQGLVPMVAPRHVFGFSRWASRCPSRSASLGSMVLRLFIYAGGLVFFFLLILLVYFLSLLFYFFLFLLLCSSCSCARGFSF